MSESAEHTREHIKLYWKIFGALLVLTVVTVGVSYIQFGVALGVTVALIIAATKGSLVASYFMHLIGERKSIYAALALTVFFFLFLIFIPILSFNDALGEPMVVPNANAPVAEEEAH